MNKEDTPRSIGSEQSLIGKGYGMVPDDKTIEMLTIGFFTMVFGEEDHEQKNTY